VRIPPKDLVKPPLAAVTEVLERDYLDRVIPDLGLAVTLYDVLSVEGGHIYPNDGAAYFKVAFRLVVFRPFRGEVLVGKIVSSSKCVWRGCERCSFHWGPLGRSRACAACRGGGVTWTACVAALMIEEACFCCS